jgi:putative membrane protein
MAEQKGSTKQVKDYGRMLVQDHEKADEQVRQVADEMHVELRIDKDDRPQTVLEHDQEQQRKMEQLQRLSGKVFDLTFAQLMSNGHQHAIDIVKNAEPTRRGDLKNLLDTLLPVLQKHKDVADQILRTVGNTASAK